MAGEVLYPGVHVEELPGAVRNIAGVPTSVTAFFGRAPRGPVGVAGMIGSYADFERVYGEPSADSMLGDAVRDFYERGGASAVIVRVHDLSDLDRHRAVLVDLEDTRTYRQLVDDALARIPVHAPEWTNFAESDPGITLLELFAFLSESLLYRANRLPQPPGRFLDRYCDLLAAAGVQPTVNAGDVEMHDALRQVLRTQLAALAGEVVDATLDDPTLTTMSASVASRGSAVGVRPGRA